MLWLIPVALVGASLLIINALENEAGEVRKNWKEKHAEVEGDIEWHRKNIESHLEDARLSCDFYALTPLHFSSMKVADEAYKLLDGAHKSTDAIGKALLAAKQEIARLEEERKGRVSSERINEIKSELEGLRALRRHLFDDKDALVDQKNNYLSELKRLNNQTRMLKEAIREKTGERGREWYERLEQRKAEKRGRLFQA